MLLQGKNGLISGAEGGRAMRDLLLVLNFDDTASRAITRKLRSERVLCRIVPGDTALEEVRAMEPLGLILAGGVRGEMPNGLDGRLVRCGMPMLALGDCAAVLLSALGGQRGESVGARQMAPLSYAPVTLLSGLEAGERMMESVQPFTLPDDLMPICEAPNGVIGYQHREAPLFGLQFEAEQNDPEGTRILRNFALDICGCTTWWDDDAFVARAVEEIGRVVGDGTAVCAMTGGLDSGVSALLAFKALGQRLKCVFVDTGLLRENEGDAFIAFYRDQLGLNIKRVCAEERFLAALKGIRDPEEKRRVIGVTMQQILDEEKRNLGSFDALISGTSYNDIMFSRGDRRPVLSTDVPVIEPVRDLFKDEIRRVGDYLGMPQDIISRQPFPGSGLALRILDEVTVERLKTLRTADAIFRAEIAQNGVSKKLWQYYAVWSPLPGRGEKDGALICLRAVQYSDRSPVFAARLPYEVTENTVEKILHACPQVRRVLYDVTPSGQFAGDEWE